MFLLACACLNRTLVLFRIIFFSLSHVCVCVCVILYNFYIPEKKKNPFKFECKSEWT